MRKVHMLRNEVGFLLLGMLLGGAPAGCGKPAPCDCDFSEPALLSGSGDALTPGDGGQYYLDLGAVDLGSLTAETLQFANDGGSGFNVLRIGTPDDAEFSIWGPELPASVFSGRPVSFAVVFTPLSPGRKTTLVQFETDTNHAPVMNLVLTGTGVADGG